jgi:hypothetical protein
MWSRQPRRCDHLQGIRSEFSIAGWNVTSRALARHVDGVGQRLAIAVHDMSIFDANRSAYASAIFTS